MTEQQIPTSEVLNRAADLIEERGWIEGEGWPTPERPVDAPLCLEGGIVAAAGISVAAHGLDAVSTCPAYVAVMDYLATDVRWGPRAHLLEKGTARAYDWNDVEGRTAAEVIEVLRAAAAIEAARESDGRGTGERVLTAEAVAS